MPIYGLTDRTPSFKEIARLRLGIPKSEAQVSGPKEISYFRPDFRPDAQDAYALFVATYGSQPTSINFRLPFAEISRCFDANYEIYNKMGMLGMSDGVKWLYLRHNRTGELLVKDGVPTHAEGTRIGEDGLPYLPFDPKVPVYSYTSKKGEEVKVFAKPTGRLRILIPELKRAAYVQIITNSLYNCMHLSEQLAGIAVIAKNAGMSLPQVPMTITRRKESISVTFNGHKQMQEHYLLNIEIDPRWMEAQFNYLNELMPGQSGPVLPALPAKIAQQTFAPEDLTEESGADDNQPAEPEDGNQVLDLQTGKPESPEPQAAPAVGISNGMPRPYPPETLKAKLLARCATYGGKTATQKQRNLVAMLLAEIFAGPDCDLMRHALQMYLFGVASLKELDSSMILVVLNDWLKPISDSGGAYKVDSLAVQEAIKAYEYAVEIQGQMALPLGENEKIPF